MPNSTRNGDAQMTWPQILPHPSAEQEERVIGALLPDVSFSGSKRSLQSALQRYTPRWNEMSPRQRNHIKVVCGRMNFDLGQAIGLRTTVFRSAQPWRFEGNEQETLAKAEAFEDAVESVLIAHGVQYETQAQQVAAYQAAHEAGLMMPPTPDFRISSQFVINNRPVRWIEVKNFYGAGVEAHLKPWTPTIKIQKQLAKYIMAYGPDGAVILKHGFAVDFRARTPECVQLLDGGMLRGD